MKHCMFVGKNSGSVFLKSVAQTKSISLLFSEYLLITKIPESCKCLLLLDTVLNPLQMQGDYSWMDHIPLIEVLPGMKKQWEKLTGQTVSEISL